MQKKRRGSGASYTAIFAKIGYIISCLENGESSLFSNLCAGWSALQSTPGLTVEYSFFPLLQALLRSLIAEVPNFLGVIDTVVDLSATRIQHVAKEFMAVARFITIRVVFKELGTSYEQTLRSWRNEKCLIAFFEPRLRGRYHDEFLLINRASEGSLILEVDLSLSAFLTNLEDMEARNAEV